MTWSATSTILSATAAGTRLSELKTGTPSYITVLESGNHTTYHINRRIRITSGADLLIDPAIETLAIMSNGRPNVEVQNGGTLTIGGDGTASPNHDRGAGGTGGALYGAGTALITGNNGEACCSSGSLRVYSGGTLNIYRATMIFGGVVRWDSNSTINVIDGRMFFHPVTASNVRGGRIRIRCEEGNNVTIRGLRTWNVQFDVLTNENFAAFEGYDPRDVTIGVEAGPNATNSAWAGSLVLLSNVPDYRDYAQALLSNWRSANNVQIRNTAAGSATKLIPDQSDSTTSATEPALGGRVFHRVKVRAVGNDGSAITGAVMHIRDTNHNARPAEFALTGVTINETADRVYRQTSAANGWFPDTDVLTGVWYRTNDVGDISEPDGNEILDVRGKNNTAGEDLFDIELGSYGHEFIQLQNQTFNGINDYERTVVLEADRRITESRTAVVAAYTTLEMPQKWYDYVKYSVADNTTYAGQQSIYVSRDGNTLDFGSTNVTLRPDNTGTPISTSADGMTRFANTGPTFTGNLQSTGVITVPQTVTVIGSVKDSSGITVTVTGLPAGHDAVVGAWRASQGTEDRDGIVTGEVADDTATSITIALELDTEYFIVADAVSYRRSAPFRLNTTSQASIEISLTRIRDASGNDLIPSADQLTDDEQLQYDHIRYDSGAGRDTFRFRSRRGSTGFAGQTTTTKGGEIPLLTSLITGKVSSPATNSGWNGVATDGTRIYALHGVRASGNGGTIYVLQRDANFTTHSTLSLTPPNDGQGIPVGWPTDICVVPHMQELYVLWSQGGLQRIPINEIANAEGLGTPDAIRYMSFPPHLFDSVSGMAAAEGLAMRGETEAYVVMTNPHVILRVNLLRSAWTADTAFPTLTLSTEPVRGVAYDEVEDRLIIIDEDEVVVIIDPDTGRINVDAEFLLTAGTGEQYVTGMAGYGNELLTVWDLTPLTGNLRLRTFGIRTGRIEDGSITQVEFFEFRPVARFMEVIQSRASSQANPYVSIFSPGSITFESGGNRTVGADIRSPREVVPDLSAFQVNKIGANHQSEFVTFDNGPIVVFSGNPTVSTLTVPSGLTVNLSEQAITDIEANGTALRNIQSLATNIAANTQPVP